MWKSIMGAWMSIRLGLAKKEPSNLAEVMKQPIFSNPSLTNARGEPLGVNDHSKGYAFARAGHTRIRDIWNGDTQDWKNLSDLKMHFHASNRSSKDIIIGSIPWRPARLFQPLCAARGLGKYSQLGYPPGMGILRSGGARGQGISARIQKNS